MATKFYLAEIPDDFPATNVKFENMTKPLLAIPAKMVPSRFAERWNECNLQSLCRT